jgi:hypothetical protein
MKSRTLALLVFALLGVSANAMAAPTLVGTTTDPTGINGLVVDGTTYNVTLSTTMFDSPFTYGSAASIAAATDLAAALTSLGVTELAGITPMGPGADGGGLVLAVDNAFGSSDFAGCGAIGPPTCSIPTWGYAFGPLPPPFPTGPIRDQTGDIVGWYGIANFTVASVPEPTTLTLFGLGLAGLGFARRRKSA